MNTATLLPYMLYTFSTEHISSHSTTIFIGYKFIHTTVHTDSHSKLNCPQEHQHTAQAVPSSYGPRRQDEEIPGAKFVFLPHLISIQKEARTHARVSPPKRSQG